MRRIIGKLTFPVSNDVVLEIQLAVLNLVISMTKEHVTDYNGGMHNRRRKKKATESN
jgi:hypothetical protein